MYAVNRPSHNLLALNVREFVLHALSMINVVISAHIDRWWKNDMDITLQRLSVQLQVPGNCRGQFVKTPMNWLLATHFTASRLQLSRGNG